MKPQKKEKPQKPPMSPEQKVAHLLATMLVNATDFDPALASLITGLAPAVRRLWQQAKMEAQLLTPVAQAMESGDPQKVLKAIYQRPEALEMLGVMSKNWMAQEEAAEAKATAAPATTETPKS